MNKKVLNIPDYADEKLMTDDGLRADIESILELEKNPTTKSTIIRHVVIDDEYFSWIHEKGMKDTQKSREKYMEEISDSEVERLWKKNHRHHHVQSYALPVIVLAKKLLFSGNFSFSEDLTDELQTILVKRLGIEKDKIFIYPSLIRPEYYIQSFSDYYESSIYKKLTNLSQEFSELKPPLFIQAKNVNFGIRFIPIVIVDNAPAIIQGNTLCKDYAYRRFNKKNVVSWLNKLSIPGLNYKVYNFLIQSGHCEEFYSSFWDILKDENLKLAQNS